MSKLESVLDVVTSWASARADIIGLALVGSHARCAALEDSDIDVVLLSSNPEWFSHSPEWMSEFDWTSLRVEVRSWRDAQYGVVWSRHIELSDGTRLELTFAHPSWAAISPCDAGTRAVVSGGCRVLYDPQQLLDRLLRNAA
jgi:hypothetical protein